MSSHNTRYAQAALLALWLSGCAIGGGEGEACENQGSMFNPRYVCDQGLVCNYGYDGTPRRPVCEKPGINGVGDTCGTDSNCAKGLWCNLYKCERLLDVGETCSGYLGCAPGLVCWKDKAVPTPHCVSAGGLGQPCRTDNTCDDDLACNAHPAYGAPICVDANSQADAGQ